ncbi:MAG: glycoside hydrolase family 5 protein [Lachnospiraceae bacterium]|nr:glycoside hydrolase family 5 protein [Lachnospiraceae bacterium]
MRKRKITALFLALIMCLSVLAGCKKDDTPGGAGSTPTAEPTAAATDAPATDAPAPTDVPADDGTLTGKTASEIVAMMRSGFNIGNTLDATGNNYTNIYSQEQSWGNPVISFKLIDALAERGFNVIRIPTTWFKYISKDGNYTIDPEFLGRVKQVVDLCYKHNVFVIINVHHEDWVNVKTLDKDYEQIGVELKAVWEQIADYFADYDQHLIFEVMNEPRMKDTGNEWNPNTAGCKAVNYLNKVAYEAIMSSHKGHNDERCVMVPTYAASSSGTAMKNMEIPSIDGDSSNVIVSIHSYTPYNFCLSDNSKTFDPAKDGRDIDNVFNDIDKYFTSKGIPVVMGETGSTNSQNNTEAREAWSYYFTSKAASYGVPCVIWDNGANGSSGGECHCYINRWTGEWTQDSIIQKFLDGANSVEWGSAISK